MTLCARKLSNGDVTVTEGTWILGRLSKATGKWKVIDYEYPHREVFEAAEKLARATMEANS
jgi:hypothetical protein